MSETTTTDATATTTPAAPVAKERKLYNYGSKKEPSYVVTFKSVVYRQPAGFVPQGDHVMLTETEGGLVDANGNIWTSEGENAGCGPRCPAVLKDANVAKLASLLPDCAVRDNLVSIGEKLGADAQLRSAFRQLSHTDRAALIKMLAEPAPESK